MTNILTNTADISAGGAGKGSTTSGIFLKYTGSDNMSNNAVISLPLISGVRGPGSSSGAASAPVQ
jgi:hypothetical protein